MFARNRRVVSKANTLLLLLNLSLAGSWGAALYLRRRQARGLAAQKGNRMKHRTALITAGSIAAVVVMLIWLSWNVNAVFFGAALATEIEISMRDRAAPPEPITDVLLKGLLS